MFGNEILTRPAVVASGLLAAILALGTRAAPARAQTIDDDPIRSKLEAALAEALPEWTQKLLAPVPENRWSSKIELNAVLRLLGEEPLGYEPGVRVPEKATRFGDESRVLRFDRKRGELRYTSRARSWTRRHGERPAASEVAQSVVTRLASDLGLPRVEWAEPVVQLQMAALGNKEIERSFPVYTLVTLGRTVNGLPVDRSDLRAAVNHKGKIQRLKVEWQPFRLPETARLAERKAVIRQAVEAILREDPSERFRLSARLAYVPQADDDEAYHLPAALIDVEDGPTPFRIAIPVAE
jgi:hypothetical protein